MSMRIVIIGAGEVGFHIADVLSKEGNDVIVIDRNEEHLKNISDSLDVQTILGSGSSPEIMHRARIDHADLLVAVTDSDETNMISCLLASTQSRIPRRIARIRNPELSSNSLLLDKDHLNIDLCINPEREAAHDVIHLLDYPGAAEVFSFAEGRIILLGFKIDENFTERGKRLFELRQMHSDVKVLVTSLIREDRLIAATGNTQVLLHDYLLAVADTKDARRVLEIFGRNTEIPRRVIISGGGNMGLLLAEQIESKGLTVKIIEKNRERCDYLAGRLKKTIILHGNGTSQELLQQENIEGTDFFLAVTNDEEANILGSLLAKKMGARNVISLISRIDYIPLVSQAGIDGVINPRNAAIGRILHFIRQGKIVSATPLRDEKAEAFEFIALETSEIITRPLKDLKLPEGVIVGAFVRGKETIIPGGDSTVLPGDHVIIFTPRSAIPQLEKFLTVKLEYF